MNWIHRTGRRIVAVSAAIGLGTVGLLALGAEPASAHADDCGTNCVLVPTPAQDPTYGVDNTGATDASLSMMRFLAHISADRTHTAANPLTVRLQPGSHYWFNYTIQFAYDATTNGNQVWNTHVVPTTVLPAFNLSYSTLDLNGSTIDQCYSATNDQNAYASCIATWTPLGGLGQRLHFGNAIVATAGATNVILDGNTAFASMADYGHLVNSAFSGDPTTGNPTRWQSIETGLTYSDWQGVRVSGGANNTVIHDLAVVHADIEWVGGDFVQIVAPSAAFITNPAANYEIQGVTVAVNFMNHSARQGVTVNGGDTIGIAYNIINDPGREVFDSEPTAKQGSQNVAIFNNVTSKGGIGYLNWNAGPLGNNFTFANNVLTGGTPTMLVQSAAGTTKTGLTITGNSLASGNTSCFTKKGTGSASFLIAAKNYDGATVTIQNNSALVRFAGQGVYLSGANSASAVTAPNTFATC
jgi:hypothetical protein